MTGKKAKLKTGAALLLVSTLIWLPQTSQAAYQKILEHSSVYTESNYGNGNTVAEVRLVQEGRFKFWQVRLPGGFWDRCDGDCSEKYRRSHLDFWETIDEDSGDGAVFRR